MRVFVTGATGFIGTQVVQELLAAGHQVLGLTRSEEGAKALAAAGAEPHRGSIEDLESLRRGAAATDGVVHLAFNHDFSKFVENCERERQLIEAIGSELAGSDRPLLITSGTGAARIEPGQVAREDSPTSNRIPRAASEQAAQALAQRGLNVSVVRLPQVHDTRRAGLISYAARVAREKGVSAYIGEGKNRWAAAALGDVARLYRLALEKRAAGAVYHAVGEEGVAMREIAEVMARGLDLPAKSIPAGQAEAHFGWLAMFAGHDMPASSEQTQRALDWHPTGPSLLADLERTDFSKV